jgi:hypothetical protein
MDLHKLIKATEYLKIVQSIQNAKIDANIKFDILFGTLSNAIHTEFPDFDYYDPDSSYADDVNAFANAFNSFVYEHLKM